MTSLRGSAPMPSVDVDLRVPPLAVLHERQSEKWAGHPPDVIASTVAELDFPIAEPVSQALRAALARHDLGYAHGVPAGLRDAFTGFARRRMNWSVDGAQLTLIPDVMAGILELSRSLAGPGGRVAFATPAYPPFIAELPHAGVSTVQLPLLADGSFDLDLLAVELRRGLKVLVLTNPHNPTGRTLPRSELEQLADLCAEYDAWVLADEIHAPLVLPGATHVPWLEVSPAARHRGISLTSASKAFNLAGLKAALLVTGSSAAQDALRKLPPAMAERAGLLGVIAAEAAFADGDDWLDALLAQHDRNRNLLGARLSTELPAVEWTPPQATYLAWLDCRGLGLGDDPAAAFLRRGRVAFTPGTNYGPTGAGFVRLNFGTSAELVREMVARMAATATDGESGG